MKHGVSSSSFKKSHKTTTKISLNSLPEELLVEISSRVAASSFSDVHNLQLVSKTFQNYCNDGYVFQRVSFHGIPLFPWHRRNREKFSKFFKRCLRNGNPEALYRKGLIDYFHLDSAKEQGHGGGIEYLARAAEKGNQEARYVYGIILICLGGKTKQKGFKILSSLIKPLMSSTVKEVATLRKINRDIILWRGGPMMRQLKGSYVREKCNCDGRTEMFLAKSCVSNGFDEDSNIITSSSSSSSSSFCEICLWHHEVHLFLKND
ncbi:hypothetical protein EUTSA_v10019573mg [Eutrema salsugineum]|uniref:F-box domain-containing protein n=1 Tax=Eutrema salsugineum TaxID=72664 RepID=V4M944_EUTSA|nr:putative F-box protein At1g67623 [Eutrema salsugineum]ESQ27666.1 hypothetical protein EUTSA_v10019573mg [Eutrema salsugineum]